MIRITAAVLLLSAYTSANFGITPIEDYIKASEGCILDLKIPSTQAAKLRKFDYEDKQDVQDYLLCKHKQLGLWNDDTGLDMDIIFSAFKSLKAEDVLSKELRDCKINEQKDTPRKWIYRSVDCVLRHPAGVLFKDLVAKFNLKPTSTLKITAI